MKLVVNMSANIEKALELQSYKMFKTIHEEVEIGRGERESDLSGIERGVWP